MASVLFTAFALIAAGQADVPRAPAESGKVQSVRSAPAAVLQPRARPKTRTPR